MSSPKKNVVYEFDIALIDTADTGAFKVNPTIAAGDFKVSTDNGALANLATLPVVSPAGSIIVKINLSAAEMNGDKIMVQCIDAAGDEWDDVLIFIDATIANVDDIVRSTTPANTLDVNATGEAGLDLDNTSGTIAAAQIATDAITAAKIAANAIGASEIAAGAIDAATFAAGAIDAAAIATDAIGAAELATDAVNEIRDAILSDSTSFAGANIAAILTDTGTTVSALTTAQNDLDTLTGTGGALIATGQTATAWSSLEASAGTIKEGTAKAGTLTPTKMSTTLTEADDVFNGRILIFKADTATAALRLQATDITDFANLNGVLTFTAVTTSPSATETFIIV